MLTFTSRAFEYKTIINPFLHISRNRHPKGQSVHSLLSGWKANFQHHIPWPLTFTCNTINSKTKKTGNSKNEPSIWPLVLIFLQNSPALLSEWPLWGSRHSKQTDSQLDSHLPTGSRQPPTSTCCCWLLSFIGCSSPLRAVLPHWHILTMWGVLTMLLFALLKKKRTAKLNYLNKDLCMYVRLSCLCVNCCCNSIRFNLRH